MYEYLSSVNFWYSTKSMSLNSQIRNILLNEHEFSIFFILVFSRINRIFQTLNFRYISLISKTESLILSFPHPLTLYLFFPFNLKKKIKNPKKINSAVQRPPSTVVGATFWSPFRLSSPPAPKTKQAGHQAPTTSDWP